MLYIYIYIYVGFNIGWKIVSSATPFNHVTNECKLCVREKYFIIFKPEMATLNDIKRRASSVSNSNFFYKTEGLRVKDGG